MVWSWVFHINYLATLEILFILYLFMYLLSIHCRTAGSHAEWQGWWQSCHSSHKRETCDVQIRLKYRVNIFRIFSFVLPPCHLFYSWGLSPDMQLWGEMLPCSQEAFWSCWLFCCSVHWLITCKIHKSTPRKLSHLIPLSIFKINICYKLNKINILYVICNFAYGLIILSRTFCFLICLKFQIEFFGQVKTYSVCRELISQKLRLSAWGRHPNSSLEDLTESWRKETSPPISSLNPFNN